MTLFLGNHLFHRRMLEILIEHDKLSDDEHKWITKTVLFWGAENKCTESGIWLSVEAQKAFLDKITKLYYERMFGK